jgi:hypothetical protein
MILCDVNIFVYAYRDDSPSHLRAKEWLESCIAADAPIGLSETVLSGFLRVVTHPRIFQKPTPIIDALKFADMLRLLPNSVRVAPGERHWDIFEKLCKTTKAAGNLVADAWLAALAIESGCEWISSDSDYGRFPGLQWRNPLL